MPPALQIRNLSKQFGGVQALSGVDLMVRAGEVHGLLGQNGSGKSTLIKILAGFHEPEPGAELIVGGEPVPLPLAPGEFRTYGISFVHQNLGLIPSLTVMENLLIGRFASRDEWRISWRAARERAAALFRRYGVPLDPSTLVHALSPVQRALLAIVRAVEEITSTASQRAGHGLLILDEPTPFLPQHDVNQLFALVREIVADGSSVVFVSHDVDEVREITDRLTVLRDGKVAGTLVTARATKADIVEMIVGRRFEAAASVPRDLRSREPLCVVESLSGGTLRNVTTDFHEGEIVGLTGLIGSGFDELPYLVFGATRATSGRLTIRGCSYELRRMTPTKAIDCRLVLIPGDRQGAGAVGSLSVADNITLPVLDSRFRSWRLDRRGMLAASRQLAETFDVRPRDAQRTVNSLSGGNQQKVVLAKWLQTRPTLILLDEPSQGVDVGAREQVFAAIRAAARTGATVACASSDYEQLAAICDRVLVFAKGQIVAELVGEDVRKDVIADRCYHSLGPTAAA